MSFVQLSGVSCAWSDRPLFEGVDLSLCAGWTGLVGENGSGKTTLLRILAGELRPDSGCVRGRGFAVLCPQSIERPDAAILALDGRDDGLARRLRERLALRGLERWHTLSGGERKRWQIGAALAREPELLLLDEPTNHLDGEARGLLLGALRAFPGIGVLVSHDRELLDALCSSTLRIHRGTVRLWPGPWSSARAAWEAEARARAEVRAGAESRAQGLARALQAAREEQASAERSRRASARMKGPRDHDGRSMGRKFLAEKAEARQSRTVALRRDALDRAREALADLDPEPTLGAAVRVGWRPCPRPVVCAVEGPIFAGETLLFPSVSLALGRQDRLWLRGRNGAGKSTLLRALSRPGEPILHLPQELSEAEVQADLQRLRSLPGPTRGRALQIVAALGVAPENLLRSPSPSPGEARKLRVALGLGEQVWAALLDEPTNHLDPESIERLSRALLEFQGALLIATHDGMLAGQLGLQPVDLDALARGA